MWDLAIVGAGPAGSAAALGALAANPRMKVALLDRSSFPRDKACGDGIAPQVLDVLAEVGVTDLLDDWRPVRRLQLQRAGETTLREMARPAWVVPREVFDARLVDAAVQAGAHLQRLRVRTVKTTADCVGLDEDLQTKVAVGADGAHSLVRSAVDLAPVRRRALALRGYAPTPPSRAGRQVIVFSETRQPSYAWSFDTGAGFANVGYGEYVRAGRSPLSRALLLQRLDELLPGAPLGGERWLGHHLPLSSWRWHQPDGRVLLAGDAAGLINPVTGEGIYYAVATGVLAGRAAAEALDAGDPASAGRRHRVAVRSLLARHLRHTALTSTLVGVPEIVTRGLRAAARDQSVFDDLVEIGLARGLLTPRLVRNVLTSGPLSRRPRY
jgi:geranylgeranyl reductase family protein